jgi:hypothetical protein
VRPLIIKPLVGLNLFLDGGHDLVIGGGCAPPLSGLRGRRQGPGRGGANAGLRQSATQKCRREKTQSDSPESCLSAHGFFLSPEVGNHGKLAVSNLLAKKYNLSVGFPGEAGKIRSRVPVGGEFFYRPACGRDRPDVIFAVLLRHEGD